MDRLEYLKKRQEDLQDEFAIASRSLSIMGKGIEKRKIVQYSKSTRDSIIQLAIELHDLKTELQDVSSEIKRRENISKLI